MTDHPMAGGDVDVVVTGVTGRIGGGVARELAHHGVRQRLLVRGDVARAPALPGAEAVVASYDDQEALAAAFRGARTLLFVSGAEHPDRLGQHRTVARVAAQAGVEHVVYTSFLGAAADATFTLARDHHHTERALADAGLAVTALRDGFYQDLLPGFFDADGVLRSPAGDGLLMPVARRDVVAVAVATLRDERWRGQVLDLVGPERLTLDDVARIVAGATGRALRHERESIEQAWASRRAGWPDAAEFELEAWVSTWLAVADGSMAVDGPGDVERVLGRPPTSLVRTVRRVVR